MQTRKYPLVPVAAAILKIVAILGLLVVAFVAYTAFSSAIGSWFKESVGLYGMPQPPVTSFAGRLTSLVQPMFVLLTGLGIISLFWVLADAVLALRDIEWNTRGGAATTATPAAVPVTKPAPTTEPDQPQAE